MPKKDVSKLKIAKGIEKIPAAKSRPGDWKKLLKANPSEENINKHTQVPPILQEAMITDVANGVAAADIEKKYEVSLGYVRNMMMRKFGSIAKMKEALTAMCYENAIAFMGFASEHISEMTPAQAILGAKLSIDSGISLEKSGEGDTKEIDFATLQHLGSVITQLEKHVSGSDRTLRIGN